MPVVATKKTLLSSKDWANTAASTKQNYNITSAFSSV